ncbi:AraC family transcriptional regulator [Glaciecola petra]|uniref:AraC family transcriptional regulator n=1 Tax=Glaciecola petra TaxID=3075602 RepID=A0ABU2ZTS5_9ALTE|nr:AraC family transcriptional regulator [Aestuariibacter sp. P117]MDT0596054.1 AraC family transcriptional regulator [Aestuariibacter sp. P117]
MSQQYTHYRSHMFSLAESELELHENLITCVIFSNNELVCVSNDNKELKAKIICIKPGVNHRVSIPAGGAEILYFDGVNLSANFTAFESLESEWEHIPAAFKKYEFDIIESFRIFLNGGKTSPNLPILAVIEELYSSPLDRMTQDKLAEKLGLERTQALKYFKSVTGQTFRRFKKWAASVTVISNVFNGQNISLAGIDAGFSDAAHTSRTARELFGLTPSSGANSLRNITTLVQRS